MSLQWESEEGGLEIQEHEKSVLPVLKIQVNDEEPSSVGYLWKL
jgi:hypothetical protein